MLASSASSLPESLRGVPGRGSSLNASSRLATKKRRLVRYTTFWTWLWGTVGLVLSTPLTVCLVVLGRHVERLAFLDVIFGDAPPLTPVENFYQRMLAGDASEVVDQAERFLKTNSLIDYYDEVALPALLMAQVDLRRGVLDEPRQRRIKETIDEVIEDLSDHVDQPPAAAPAPEPFALENSGGSSLPSSAPSFPKSYPKSCGNRRGAVAGPAARRPHAQPGERNAGSLHRRPQFSR